MNTLPHESDMYRALCDRDPTYDGIFFACVKTTGIFCRPVCTARKPKAANVEFVATADEAVKAGYRPCKVCSPIDDRPERPAWVDRLMSHMDHSRGIRLGDEDLRALGIEPSRARRYFKKHFGVTFQSFQRAQRLGRAMRLLSDGETVATAAFESGFTSESGFRTAYQRLFGETPGATRGHVLLKASWIPTPLGSMIAIANDESLVLLEFLDRENLDREINVVSRRYGSPVVPGRTALLDEVEVQLAEYFNCARHTFDLALDVTGTEFQTSVWTQLRSIPPGVTASYIDIARAIGKPKAVRAVGRANGQNRLAIVIPCHRVIRSDGSLSGYGGGVWRKRRLLELEAEMTTPRSTRVSSVA